MSKMVNLASLVLVSTIFLVQTITAQKIHFVGDSMGWIVPPLGSSAYRTWAAANAFHVGDILVFNFIGEQDVAQVTGEEAFEACNSTNAVIIGTSSPTNFTITSLGEYYFISTVDTRCDLGQKLAINVTTSPPPPPPRAPATYIVGDEIGWIVPPGGAIAYSVWANFNKTFIVGDTLVFNFVNETSDVAVVSQSSYETCDTNSSTTVLTTSPARYTLARTGGHYFTSTYPRRCILGQRLAINVTGDPASTLPPSSGPTTTPPSSLPENSAPRHGVAAANILFFMSIGVAFLA